MSETVHLSSAGTGVEYAAPDATVTVKIGTEHTGGQYEVFEIDAPRADAAPPHTESWSKAFYVLQGRILVQAGCIRCSCSNAGTSTRSSCGS
jgi:quercetin dioxygenase-like cupin family protein